MADDTDTPTTGTDTPAPRRRGPRKDTAKAPAKRRTAAKSATGSTVEQAEAAVKNVATRVKRTAVKAEGAVIDAAKSVKPRAAARAKPAAKTPAKTAAKSGRKTPAKARTNKWGVAAIAGGIAAAGAAAAALLSVKASTARNGTPTDPAKGGHQPDGTDASKSFNAAIADENTVPN